MKNSKEKEYKYKKTWNKTPSVFQMEVSECGAASLGIILGYYKRFVSLEQLRIDCGVSKDGCNALNIYKAAQKNGLDVEAYKYDMESLITQKEPCIIHWNFNHFVVFEGIKNGHPYINDPAHGRRKISFKELDESFTGIVLTFKKSDSFQKIKKESPVINFLFRRTSNQIKSLVLLFLISLVLVAIGLLTATFSKIFIDDILIAQNFNLFLSFVIVMLITLISYFLFANLKNFIINKLQLKLSLVFGYNFLDHTLKLPTNFYDQRYAGDLSQRINNNDTANSFLSSQLTSIFIDAFTAIFYLFFMIIYSVPLSIISIIGLFLSLLISYQIIDSVKEKIIKLNQENGKLYGILFSGVEISSTLKACGIEDMFVDRLINQYSSMGKIEQEIGRKGEVLNFLPTLILQATNILILLIGAYFVIEGEFSMGTLATYCVIFSSFTAPVNSLFSLFQKIQNLRANLLRVNDIENYEIDERFKNNVDNSDMFDNKLRGDIQLKNLTFGYSNVAKPLLDDFNLDIKPGEIVAFVGPSGCGKSTIINVLSGLYHPWKGSIIFDGKDYTNYSQSTITNSISIINQESVMFSGTVKENLTFWNEHTLDSDLIKASKDACIYDTISLFPDGYNYKLTQGAKNLSGGQRQRLEIARSLVNNPSILLMDEATSSLDPIVEKNIIKNIKKRGCTCIIVAHRLSTIRDADKIVCIDNGKIIQIGTHDELKDKPGLYKDLIKNI